MTAQAWIELAERMPDRQSLDRISERAIEPLGEVAELVVRRNDTMERIFRNVRVELGDLAAIRAIPGVREHLDLLRPGERIELTHLDGNLQRLVRRIGESAILSVTRVAEGFTSTVIETPVEIRTVSTHGEIKTSLFASGLEAGLSSDLLLRLANDVFGWDIDFSLEIQPGDSYTVVYERKYRDGQYLSDGRVLAAEFINAGRTYQAIRFESDDGAVADYFSRDGKSMRKQFLRAPVEFRYVSSNFNPKRLHPILKIRRAHQGVDYSAPKGTPIKASGDGRVSFVGVKGGYGNAIILEHGGSVSTLYAHMSRFAPGMRRGMHVKQGDIIGFVGSTGTATASHLHYEYRINGVHKNPRTVSLPDASPIPAQYSPEFGLASAALLAQLDQVKVSRLAALAAP